MCCNIRYVTPVELRRVLEHVLDLQMSNTAYCKALHHINSHRDSGVNYAEFLLRYGGALPPGRHGSSTHLQHTNTAVRALNGSSILAGQTSSISPSKTEPPAGLQQKLDRAVRTHMDRLKAAFRTRDWRGTGLLSPAGKHNKSKLMFYKLVWVVVFETRCFKFLYICLLHSQQYCVCWRYPQLQCSHCHVTMAG